MGWSNRSNESSRGSSRYNSSRNSSYYPNSGESLNKKHIIIFAIIVFALFFMKDKIGLGDFGDSFSSNQSSNEYIRELERTNEVQFISGNDFVMSDLHFSNFVKSLESNSKTKVRSSTSKSVVFEVKIDNSLYEFEANYNLKEKFFTFRKIKGKLSKVDIDISKKGDFLGFIF